MLGQMKYARAVGEERRAAFAQIEPAGVELRQRGDEGGRRLPLALCEARHDGEQLLIGKSSETGDRWCHVAL
ncbi:MAG TPA: hypothetical protein VF198_07240 [Vicinamibacterales bacterium]